MLTFDLQIFGGGKGPKITYQQAQIPTQSPTEAALQQEQLKWAQTTQPVANNLLNMAHRALNTQQVNPNPNWQTLYNNAQNQTTRNNQLVQGLIPQVQANTNANAATNNQYSGLLGNAIQSMTQGNKELASEYNTAMQNNNTAMQGLLNGVLPSSYAENRQKALQSDLTNTVGNTLSGLASRGIINSSQADSVFNDISRNASNTLAAQYGNDMQTAAGLAGQAYNNRLAGINGKAGLLGDMFRNQLSGYGQQADLANTNFNNRQQGISTLSQLANQSQQMAMDPIKTAATAQEAAINVPMQYLSMATGQNAPTQGLLSQLSQQRYSVASPAQAVVQQGNGGFFGGLMSGLGSFFACFKAGTKIATPAGPISIEKMGFGDKVISLGDVCEVTDLHDMGEEDIYRLDTSSCSVETTETEIFLTEKGKKQLSDLNEHDLIMTVHGFDPVIAIEKTGETATVYELELTGNNMFYANGILAEGLTEEDKKANEEARLAEEIAEAMQPVEDKVPVKTRKRSVTRKKAGE